MHYKSLFPTLIKAKRPVMSMDVTCQLLRLWSADLCQKHVQAFQIPADQRSLRSLNHFATNSWRGTRRSLIYKRFITTKLLLRRLAVRKIRTMRSGYRDVNETERAVAARRHFRTVCRFRGSRPWISSKVQLRRQISFRCNVRCFACRERFLIPWATSLPVADNGRNSVLVGDPRHGQVIEASPSISNVAWKTPGDALIVIPFIDCWAGRELMAIAVVGHTSAYTIFAQNKSIPLYAEPRSSAWFGVIDRWV